MRKTFLMLELGDTVCARIRVYDIPGENYGPPHARALLKYPHAAHIHAEPGDLGEITRITNTVGVPSTVTVTFRHTGTFTECTREEVEHVEGSELAYTWENILRFRGTGELSELEFMRTMARRFGYYYFLWNDLIVPTNSGREISSKSCVTISQIK